MTKTIIYRKEYKENMEIIQVNQFASGEHIEVMNFDDITESLVHNDPNTHDIVDHIGTSFQRKTVTSDDEPFIGNVWYKKGNDGKCEYYKAHYDSSD